MDKACPSSCNICNVAKEVTGHAYRRFSAELAKTNFSNEFYPPPESSWSEFSSMSEHDQFNFVKRHSANTSFLKDKVIHVAGTGDQIRKGLASFNVVRRKDIFPYSGSLEGLLKCQKVLVEWQKLDITIRNTVRALKQGLDAPTKDAKVRTLMDKFRVKLDGRGILVTHEDDGPDIKTSQIKNMDREH